MLFRSLVNSRVAILSVFECHQSETALGGRSALSVCHHLEASEPFSAGAPSFSTRTSRADSVGSPIFVHVPEGVTLREAPLHKHIALARDWSPTSLLDSAARVEPFLLPSVPIILPTGHEVVPSTEKPVRLLVSVSGTNIFTHDIWFVVSVPVLSVQITVVHPKVSTEGSLRTMEFFFAIFLVPSARQVVMTAGSPSGIAATARATAILK
mmetsp:Transcript_49599/g.97718  ORF Transcript_49599/g.97718 Transcript_49599/m.97718 type:complete len:210 (-) Transcript_49599:1228-1857(-)